MNLMTRSRASLWRNAKLANRVKGRRRRRRRRRRRGLLDARLIPGWLWVDSRLRARLRGTFKDLSREIRFSPDLQPRCIPFLHGFLPPSSTLLSLPTHSFPANFPPSLAPSTFHRAFAPRGGHRGENWTFVELSVNVLARLPLL